VGSKQKPPAVFVGTGSADTEEKDLSSFEDGIEEF